MLKLSLFRIQGSAAGRGSATSLEFLEKAYEAARREREDVESPAPNGEINESFGNEFGVRKSQGSKGGRDYGMDGGGEESGESPKESDRGKSLIGFGVVGEEETVQLALRALSKVWRRVRGGTKRENACALNRDFPACRGVFACFCGTETWIEVFC